MLYAVKPAASQLEMALYRRSKTAVPVKLVLQYLSTVEFYLTLEMSAEEVLSYSAIRQRL